MRSFIVAFTFLLSSVLFLGIATAAELELEVTDYLRGAAPGGTASFSIYVVNHTDQPKTVTLSHLSVNDWPVTMSASVQVPADEQLRVPVTVKVPETYPPYSDVITITVTEGVSVLTCKLEARIGWYPRTPLPEGSFGHSALYDGQRYFYIVGGTNDEYIHPVWRYDTASDSYETLAAMPDPNTWGNACLMNGKIYYVGGIGFQYRFSTAMQIYDIDGDRWTLGEPLPTPPGPTVYLGAVCDPTRNRVWTAGGTTYNGKTDQLSYYDVAADAWFTDGLTPLPQAQEGVRLIYRDDTLRLIGNTYSADYDIADNEWREFRLLTDERVEPAYDAYDDLELVVAGWHHHPITNGIVPNDTMLFRVRSDSPAWAELPMLLPNAQTGAGGFAKDGTFYIFGGISPSKAEDGPFTAQVFSFPFDPAVDDDDDDDDDIDDDDDDDDDIDDDDDENPSDDDSTLDDDDDDDDDGCGC